MILFCLLVSIRVKLAGRNDFFLSLLHVFDVTKNKTIVVSTTISWWQLRKIFCTLELLKMLFFCHQSFSFLLLRFKQQFSQAAKRKQKNFQCPKKKSKNIDVNQICCPLWTALLNKPAQLRRIKCKVYTQCKHLASVKVAVTHKQAS